MDQARRRAERVPRKHSFRQRLSSARVPPSVGREEEIEVTGRSSQAGTWARMKRPALRRRPSAGLLQDQAMTTRRAAQDSNPSHGAARLTGQGYSGYITKL